MTMQTSMIFRAVNEQARNLSRTVLTVLLALILLMAIQAPAVVNAEGLPYSIGTGFEFASGTYGTDTRSLSIYVPLTIGFYPGRFDVSVEIPYVYQSNGSGIFGMFPGAQGNKTMMRSVAMGMGGTTGGGATGGGPATSSIMQSEHGLGDVTAKVGYVLVKDEGNIPQIRPNILVKFPTASKEKSLGTGEYDESVAVEISKWFDKCNVFVESGYTFQGKSELLSLRNFWSYSGGIAYQLSETFRPLIYFKGESAPSDTSSDLEEVRLKLKFQPTTHTGFEIYLAKGFTTNSPDYGTGLALNFDF
jgi:Putative MetA-pathway of phenol degradation